MKAAPLTELLKEDVQFSWGEKEQGAFEEIKQALIQAPVLVFPNFELPFVLVTDASEVGVGACLMQNHDKGLNPIAFYSRKWETRNHDETKLATVDKEAYAVVPVCCISDI